MRSHAERGNEGSVRLRRERLAINLEGMDAARDFYDPLAHFERSTTLDGVAPARRAGTRGVGWVLQWYAALVTLLVAASILAELGYLLRAERTLARAARAGALEATLPRATAQSVAQVVQRRLAGYPPHVADRVRFSLHQNGAPLRGVVQARQGDRLSVSLALPAREVLPRWLRPICFWHAGSQIAVRAEQQIPGRNLAGI